jgi:RNA polymerase sigma-70 factor (ECF subfamily)
MSHTLTEEARWPAKQPAQDLGEIYRENVDYVWRVLSHLGVKPADVGDVAHDVFITIKRRLPTFEGRSSLRTWIYGICLRTVSDYRGRAFRRREVPHDEVPEIPQSAEQLSSVEDGELRGKLLELLESLRPEQRDVFVLYEIEELSMKEVAQAVDCPLQTAYSRLHAARAQLKAKLKNGGYHP